MAFGLILFMIGYVLFYWGQQHFGGQRYSLWCLMGLKQMLPPGQLFTFGGTQTTAPSTPATPGAAANPPAQKDINPKVCLFGVCVTVPSWIPGT